MFDNDGLTVRVTAPSGGLEKGQFYFDSTTDWAGFVLDTVAEGELVAMEIGRGHRFNVAASLNVAVGEILYVQDNGTLDTEPDEVVRPFMKVTEVTPDVVTNFDQVVGVVLSQIWGSNTPVSGS
jgi:hypothetical protein